MPVTPTVRSLGVTSGKVNGAGRGPLARLR